MDIDTSALKGAATSFRKTGDDLNDGADRHRTDIAGLGNFAGDDSIGAAFYSSHEQVSTRIKTAEEFARKVMANLADLLEALGSGVTDMDASAAESFRFIEKSIATAPDPYAE